MEIHPKVAAAGQSSGVAGALSIVIIYVLEQYHITMTPEVAGAFAFLITALAGAIAGYLTPSTKGS